MFVSVYQLLLVLLVHLCFFVLQNIDFMPTILSRFDMIYIIKDLHDVAKDTVSQPELDIA